MCKNLEINDSFIKSRENCFLGVMLLKWFLRCNAVEIDPFNVCKHLKPRLGARAAWGQKNGVANRPAYCVKEKQTSLIDR